MTDDELDARPIPKPQRHPLIFERFSQLDVGGAFTIVSNHAPRHLRDEFERDHGGQFTWDYLESGPEAWRVRIGRCSSDLPRVLGTAHEPTSSGDTGATWKLDVRERQLDANVNRLAPGGQIETHRGPDLDVLVLVVAGAGTLISRVGAVSLLPGQIVRLPRRSDRSFVAGPEGISYLTVHQRRPMLRISEAGG
jgi:uncharacterized protein (DUF2249 family)